MDEINHIFDIFELNEINNNCINETNSENNTAFHVVSDFNLS